MRLHLGVVDLPYVSAPDGVNVPRPEPIRPPRKDGKPRKVRAKKHGPWQPGSKVHVGEQTTGDVAGWLEERYHVMSVFAYLNADRMAASLEDSLAGSLESMMMGAPTEGTDPFASGTAAIEQRFREFLSQGEMERWGFDGVPTKAALMGVSHRFKSKRGSRRPSFVDSGLYSASFRVWVAPS